MLQSFIIVLREGFEAFLIVAITLSYLRKTGQARLAPAVYWAVAAAAAASTALAYALNGGVDPRFVNSLFGRAAGSYVNGFLLREDLREGVLGAVAVVLVVTFLIYMWRTGHRLKADMERRLGEAAARPSGLSAFAGVFVFTLLMVTREGIESALLLLQVRDPQRVSGMLLGLGAAAGMAWMWVRFSHLIDLKRFFQVTTIYLLLFMVQVAFAAVEDLTEARVLPGNERLGAILDVLAPDGSIGKWLSVATIGACAAWLFGAWAFNRLWQTRSARLAGQE
jgi:high-affinity iron transporter